MSDKDGAEKSFQPTQKKLDDARRKGEIPASADLNTAMAYGGLLIGAAMFGGAAFASIGAIGAGFIGAADRWAPLFLDGRGTAAMGGTLGASALAIAPIFALPAGAVAVFLLARRGVVFAPEKLQPKLSRISPPSTMKQKFGPSGLFEFAKSLVKLIVVSAILASFLSLRSEEIIGSAALPAKGAIALLLRTGLEFLAVIAALQLVIGGIDFAWQLFDHRRKNMMSLEDIKDETKESDGDPHLKQERRQRAQAIASNRMMADVPDSSVVVVNPTHYAVALKWDRSQPGAPVCVAKGVDEIAAQIRRTASEAGVPIHGDPPTARALHATVEIGAEIPADLYEPVAAAIRFAERVREKARGL
ncbi:flagellar type III secretion system protein FlhB [Roseicyclus sp. F158]|uniref:Flagellar type III secretion system protein FlhB n=1 Tax=Tropicimonas omnivorans TaxID=3075590 RepID=A0ABU3DD88_9RHOB|nr:flagellar type III secretion system protein FlhB [Roseicyclus sp. F158]MDT0681683.1 flagellar type III secretion system protein FlhB [Roseicyclus sp. F158]